MVVLDAIRFSLMNFSPQEGLESECNIPSLKSLVQELEYEHTNFILEHSLLGG